MSNVQPPLGPPLDPVPDQPLGPADSLTHAVFGQPVSPFRFGVDHQVTITESVGVRDATDRTTTARRAPVDLVGLRDLVGAGGQGDSAETYRRVIADTVGVRDLLSQQVTVQRTLTDALRPTDSSAERQQVPLTDRLGLTDSTAVERATKYALTESVGLSDSIRQALTSSRAIVDGLRATDPADGRDTARRSATDPVRLTDDVAETTRKTLAAEPIGVTDEVRLSWVRRAVITERIGATDPPSDRAGMERFTGARTSVRVLDPAAFTFPSQNPQTVDLAFRTETAGRPLLGVAGNVTAPHEGAPNGWVPGLLVTADGRLRAELWWTGTEVNHLLSTARVDDGLWHHVAVTFDGVTERLYLDGVEQGTGITVTQTGFAGTYLYTLGAAYESRGGRLLDPAGYDEHGDGWQHFLGDVSDLRTSGTALSAAAVSERYRALRIEDSAVAASRRPFADRLGITDTAIGGESYDRRATDRVGLSDALRVTTTYPRSFTDPIRVSDLTRQSAASRRTHTDLLRATDPVRDVDLARRDAGAPEPVGMRDSIAVVHRRPPRWRYGRLHPVREGGDYVASVFGQALDVERPGFGEVTFYDTALREVAYPVAGPNIALTTSQPARVVVPCKAPPGAVWAGLRFGVVEPAAGNRFLWDGVQWENGALVTAYAPKPDEILPGTIKAPMLGSGSVTEDAVALDAIGLGKIKIGAVTAPTIAINAIENKHVSPGAITGVNLAAGTVTSTNIAAGTITTTNLATGAVTTEKITPGAVTAGTIADGAVGSAAIALDAITESKIADGAITTPLLAAGAVVAGTIAASAITSDKISAGAVTATSLAAGSVTANAVAANAISTAALQANSVKAAQIEAGAVTATAIAANAITAQAIAAGAVTASAIAASAVVAGALAANSVTAQAVAADAIVAGKIAADAIGTRELAANAVTAAEITAGAINAGHITAGAVTTSKIATNAITAASGIIADATIGTAKIVDAAIGEAKIADGAIVNAKIRDATILNAKIGNAQIDDAKIGSVTATKITAGAIQADWSVTSGRIQTAASGARAVMASDGFSIYDGGGTRTVHLANSGSAYFRGLVEGSTVRGGVVQTASGGSRVELRGDDNGPRDSVRFYDGNNNLSGEVRGYMGDIGLNGIHLNHNVEIGNTQSVIYQVGRRDTGNGNTRVRAGRVSVSTPSGGSARVSFSPAFPSGAVPRVAATVHSSGSTPVMLNINSVDHTGFNVALGSGTAFVAAQREVEFIAEWFA